MSAEGKKKRGIAGLSNAKSIPFRYGQIGAWQPPMNPHSVPARKWNRETIVGMIGGVLAAKLGHPIPPLTPQILFGIESVEAPDAQELLDSLSDEATRLQAAE